MLVFSVIVISVENSYNHGNINGICRLFSIYKLFVMLQEIHYVKSFQNVRIESYIEFVIMFVKCEMILIT